MLILAPPSDLVGCAAKHPAGRCQGCAAKHPWHLRVIGAEEVLKISTPTSYPIEGSGALAPPAGQVGPSRVNFCTEVSLQWQCKSVLPEFPFFCSSFGGWVGK